LELLNINPAGHQLKKSETGFWQHVYEKRNESVFPEAELIALKAAICSTMNGRREILF
jgi:hypothetical protein